MVYCLYVQDKVHLCLYALDADQQNIAQFFSQTNTFIHQARLAGGNVLVHWWVAASVMGDRWRQNQQI